MTPTRKASSVTGAAKVRKTRRDAEKPAVKKSTAGAKAAVRKSDAAPSPDRRTANKTAAKSAAPAIRQRARTIATPKSAEQAPARGRQTPSRAPSKTAIKKPAKTKSAPRKSVAAVSKTVAPPPPPAHQDPDHQQAPRIAMPTPKPPTPPVGKDAPAPTPGASKKPRFNKNDLEQFRADLIQLRLRINGQSGAMRHQALERHDEVNPEEDGTDAFMRFQTLGQVSNQQQIIADIDEALRAIAEGSYGVCDMCGELIGKPRLAVVPFAKNCIGCQSEMERHRRGSSRR